MKQKDIITISLAAIILLAGVYTVPSLLDGSTTFLIVLSGSMVPVMQVGDAIVVTHINPEDIRVGDIIAFKDPGGKPNVLITHRVIGIDSETLNFHTKGDAVEDTDPFIVTAEDVVGKAVFSIPYMGYLKNYAKKPAAFLLFTIIPASVLIMGEIRKIMRSPAQEHRTAREVKRKQRLHIALKYSRLLTIFLITALLFGAISFPFLGTSGSAAIKDEITIENRGLLPGVFVVNAVEDEMIIPPIVLPEYNESVIMINDGGTQHTMSISSTPYIMPVFWIAVLAGINPYLPLLISAILPPILITLILFPLWYEKRDKHRRSILKKLKSKLIIIRNS